MTGSLVSVGVAAALGPDIIGRLAPVVERAGFHALWVNDTPDADIFGALAAAARSTSTLVLATGVVAVDRRGPADIAASVRAAALPVDRLVLGIGSGALRKGALHAVGAAADALRGDPALDGARVVVGALGPRMRALAATRAQGALLSWLTPSIAAAQAAELREVSPDAFVALYARTALESDAVARRDAEARRYGSFPAYAANFARLGIEPLETVLPRPGESLAEGAEAYTAAVDELILRATTAADDLADYVRFVESAGSLLAR